MGSRASREGVVAAGGGASGIAVGRLGIAGPRMPANGTIPPAKAATVWPIGPAPDVSAIWRDPSPVREPRTWRNGMSANAFVAPATTGPAERAALATNIEPPPKPTPPVSAEVNPLIDSSTVPLGVGKPISVIAASAFSVRLGTTSPVAR